jgi:hypothetical protein
MSNTGSESKFDESNAPSALELRIKKSASKRKIKVIDNREPQGLGMTAGGMAKSQPKTNAGMFFDNLDEMDQILAIAEKKKEPRSEADLS